MFPDWSAGNPYQELLAKGLRAEGWSVVMADYPGGLLPLQRAMKAHPSAKVLHLHWIAPYVESALWASSGLRFWLKKTLLWIDLLLCRLRGRRLVWTVHNRIEHDSLNAKREALIRAMLARRVNHLIFHSQAALEVFRSEIADVSPTRCSVIPHGNYAGVYADDPATEARLRSELNLDEGQRVMLFFGLLRRYKGVTDLIRAFSQVADPQLLLVIAGRVVEADLANEINELAAKDARVRLRTGFVPDEEVAPLHRIADVVAIPFSRTLTSGSVILAMTMGKALILPEAARVLDAVDESGALFFDDCDSLVRCLVECDAAVASELGKRNAITAAALDWKAIAGQTAAMYVA